MDARRAGDRGAAVRGHRRCCCCGTGCALDVPERAPARAGPLLALAALAVLTHPTLDWLNNYGMRWLMPFDGRWSYGDALFIVDPWVWLALGGVLFLGGSRSAWAFALWAVFWAARHLAPVQCAVRSGGRHACCGSRASLRCSPCGLFRPELGRPPASERLARVALGCVVAYMATAVVASAVARREVRATLADLGIGPVTRRDGRSRGRESVRGHGRGRDAGAVPLGEWRWFAEPRLRLRPQPLERRAEGPIVAAASRTPSARDYLTWSRYPYFEIETTRRRLRRARARCPVSRPGWARGPGRAPRRRSEAARRPSSPDST